MKFKFPTVESWLQFGKYEHIARCAKVCYASKKVNDDITFCEALWKNKHRSMFRHAGVYYIIPQDIEVHYKAFKGADYVVCGDKYYISANEQSAREYFDTRYKNYRISTYEAFNNKVFIEYKLLRVTLCIETGIDITREYNRKSPNSIAEQSTRYVDFNKKLGIVFKKCHWMFECNWYQTLLYKFMAKVSEWFYKLSRSKYGLNLPPQDARWILPLDVMSKVVYTYTIKEWEYIVNMRLWNWTGKAHPDAKIVADMIKHELLKLGFKLEKYSDEFEAGHI